MINLQIENTDMSVLRRLNNMSYIIKFIKIIGMYGFIRVLYWRIKYFGKDARGVFSQIYRSNQWGNEESRSGPGSSIEQARLLISALPGIFEKLSVRSVLDIPCGDFNWMSKVQMSEIQYLGADIVPDIVAHNNQNFASEFRTFICVDLMKDIIPYADLVFCRDCLVHLPNKAIIAVIENIRKSSALYFMSTTFTNVEINADIPIGDFRPLNLMRPPFSFPEPLMLVNEGCTEADGLHKDKSMGIWRVIDLPARFG